MTRNESLHKTPICVLHHNFGVLPMLLGLGLTAEKAQPPYPELGGPREPRSLGYCDNTCCFLSIHGPAFLLEKKETSHQLACVTCGRVATMQSPWKAYVQTQHM